MDFSLSRDPAINEHRRYWFGRLRCLAMLNAVEEKFEIELQDEAIAQVVTATELFRVVVDQLASRSWKKGLLTKWSEEEAWETLRGLIAENLCLPLDKVTKDARIVEDLGAG